ncbi:hypothetical protein GGF37_001636 [Kickxella alabastrina]|nr:hypothetical protein GGF37_001636 [Kickxella alabastrina]
MHVDSTDKELGSRRKRLYSTIKGKEWPLDFEAFIESLGVEKQYNRFIKYFPSLFLNLAKASPVLQNKKLVTNTECTPDESDVFRTVPPTSLNVKEEFRYVKFVDQSLTVMSEKVDALNKNISDDSAKAPGLMLVIEDRQEADIVGSAHKPDLAFYHRAVIKRGITTVDFVLEAKMDLAPNGPSDKIGGQLADYANALWENDGTRTFAPVFYLHGGTTDTFNSGASTISQDQVHTMTDKCAKEGCKLVVLGNPIPRPSPLIGSRVYLYRGQHNGMPVILKLSWTNKDRLPEGAVYDILHSGRVELIPKVISSGLLYRDSGKYRLGFVIMEDCGLSMAEYLKGKPDYQKNEVVPAFVNQLTLCLAQA